MRILIAWAVLAASMLACQPAQSAATAELSAQFARRLEQHLVLRADFVQEKQMAAFKKPLVTRGRLVYVRDEGVIWKVEAPLKLAYVLTDKRIVEIGEDGKAVMRHTKDVPGIEQVGRVFRALLGAQPNAVSDLFSITATGTPAAWRMTLTPRSGPLSQYMGQIQLNGGRNVDKILIEEAGGDKTAIVFRNTTEDDAPSAEERALLGGQK
jgi:hypothetical protein